MEGAEAEVELEDEIGDSLRGISLWRTVDAVVGVETGFPVMVNGAWRPSSVRWLTVEVGGVVGGRGFLHGEAISEKEGNPN